MLGLLSPARFTGPILTKELRVASRRRRHYLLRVLYVAFLLLVMVLIWFPTMQSLNSGTLMIARMSEAAKEIIASIAWFQFIALQIVCVILLCTSISEEIYHRTLPALISTPITSFQIVTGKLLSKFLQMLQLFALSLPLLALLRVFGGVPWTYLVSSFCITLTTLLYLSCLTLFFSIFFKRAYVVMIFTVITAGILFGLIPLGLVFIAETSNYSTIFFDLEDVAEILLYHVSPYPAFFAETDNMINPGSVASFSWPAHCIYMIAASAPIFILSCALVRSAARKHMTPRTKRKTYKPPKTKRKSNILYRPFFLHSLIRKHIGSGMIWKEFLTPVLGRFRFAVYAAFLFFVLMLLISMISALFFGSIELIGFTFISSIVTFFCLAVLFTIIVPAACITSEKEAQTWPILLSTPIEHKQILAGKIVGILRRVIIAWCPFVLVFAMVTHVADFPIPALIQIAVIAIIATAFLIASGVYFSARLKRTTPAVFANLTLTAVLWGLIPGIFSALNEVYRYRSPLGDPIQWMLNLTWYLTPAGLITSVTQFADDNFDWFYQDPRFMTCWLAYIALYVTASILLLWRAKANLRRHLT